MINKLPGRVSAVSPLGEALDGTPKRRRRRSPIRPHMRQGRVTHLHPMIAAWLIAEGIELLRVEIVSETEVVVHNRPRYWSLKSGWHAES
jgi:hypothetical protein